MSETSSLLQDFIRRAIPAHVIGEYWYCAAKLWHRKKHGDVVTEVRAAGKTRHEQLARSELAVLGKKRPLMPQTVKELSEAMTIQLKNALTKHAKLVNSQDHTLFLGVAPQLGLIGCPDVVDCTDGINPVIMERKFLRAGPPTQPWLDHQVQLGAYLLCIEALGFQQPKGILRYEVQRYAGNRRSVEFNICLDSKLRAMVKKGRSKSRAIADGTEDPCPTKNAMKCRSCEYAVLCRWRRDRTKYSPPLFIDIETDLSGELIWLVGVYSSSRGQLYQWFAHSPDEERVILSNLGDLVSKDAPSSVIFFSHTLYDRCILKKRLQTYNMNFDFLKRMVELGDRLRRNRISTTGGFKKTAASAGFKFRTNIDGFAAALTYYRYLNNPSEELKNTLLTYNEDDVRGLVCLSLKYPQALESLEMGEDITTDDLEFLKRVYSTNAHLYVYKRERHDTEIRFTTLDTAIHDRLCKILRRGRFLGTSRIRKRHFTLRMYGKQQTKEFLELLKLDEELSKLFP